MSIEQLFNENPHATALIQSWFMGKMLESLNDNSVPEDFKEMMRQQGVEKAQLVKMVEASPRALFDVLDENDLIISMNFHIDSFRFNINDSTDSIEFSSRKDAEMAAITEAFKLLEQKIKSTDEEN